jgi:hypothetical protein
VPLDGQRYFGPLALLPPAYHHPESPTVAEVAAEGLRGGYQHIRHAGKLIGHQPYSAYMRAPSAYGDNLDQFIASSWVDVGDFDGALILAEATHIYAIAHYRIHNTSPAVVYHRVVVDVGGANDTGDRTEDERETATTNPLGGRTNRFVNMTLVGPGDPLNSSSAPFVVLSNVSGSLPAEARVRVQAFAQDETGANQAYTPLLVEAFWASVG